MFTSHIIHLTSSKLFTFRKASQKQGIRFFISLQEDTGIYDRNITVTQEKQAYNVDVIKNCVMDIALLYLMPLAMLNNFANACIV